MVAGLKQESFASQLAKGGAWVGTPASILEQIHAYDRQVGGFDVASLQVNFNTLDARIGAASLRRFAEQVMPHVRPCADAR